MNLLSDKAKNNLSMFKMDRINSLDRKFKKALNSRKSNKRDDDTNYHLVKLLAKKAEYDIKYGNKERGLKNLSKLKKIVKDPLHNPYSWEEFKKMFKTKGYTTAERFLRSFLPSDVRNFDKGATKRTLNQAKKAALDIISDPTVPNAILNTAIFGLETLPDRFISDLISTKDNFKALMKLVNHASPIELKNLGFSYKGIAAAYGASKAKQLFGAIKDKLNNFGDKLSDLASKPKENLSTQYSKESYIRKYKLKPKIYTEDTKNLLKDKDQLGIIDKIELGKFDADYKKQLRKRKNQKYLKNNDYYTDKPIKSIFANDKKDEINDDVVNTLVKKSIYDIKYGNEKRGLKNLNKLLDMKTKGKGALHSNFELLNTAINSLPVSLSSLNSLNDFDVRDAKQSKIADMFWSKKKPVLSTLLNKVKSYFKKKKPDMAEVLSETTIVENVVKYVHSNYKNLNESEQIKMCIKLSEQKVRVLLKESSIGDFFKNNIRKSVRKLRKLDNAIGNELGLNLSDEDENE